MILILSINCSEYLAIAYEDSHLVCNSYKMALIAIATNNAVTFLQDLHINYPLT